MEPWTLDEVIEIYAYILARIKYLNRYSHLSQERNEELWAELEFDARLLQDLFRDRLIKGDTRQKPK